MDGWIGGCFDTLLEESVVIVIIYIIDGWTVHSTAFCTVGHRGLSAPASTDSEIQKFTVFLNVELGCL